MTARARLNAWARRLKPLSAIRSLGSPASLTQTRRAYSRLGLRRLPFGSVRHAQVAGRGDEPARLDRDDGLAELERDPAFAELAEATKSALREWPQRGYLVLEGFVDGEQVDAINAQVEGLLGGGDLHYHHRSPRVMNAWRKSAAVAGLVDDPRLRGVMELILGREPRLFQTISFIVGSQQSAHSDAFHMMTEPPGYLIGVWAALEDVDADSGPVFYLPGSHRRPYVMSDDLDLDGASPMMVADKGQAYQRMMKQVVAEAEVDPVPFTAKKGDVLLWHHNLLHGGEAIERQGATRKSLVAHFFACDVLCYHEVTERPALMPADRS